MFSFFKEYGNGFLVGCITPVFNKFVCLVQQPEVPPDNFRCLEELIKIWYDFNWSCERLLNTFTLSVTISIATIDDHNIYQLFSLEIERDPCTTNHMYLWTRLTMIGYNDDIIMHIFLRMCIIVHSCDNYIRFYLSMSICLLFKPSFLIHIKSKYVLHC